MRRNEAIQVFGAAQKLFRVFPTFPWFKNLVYPYISTTMSFFNYDLPKDKIAQWPISLEALRSDSKLLQASIAANKLVISDAKFTDLKSILRAGDLLVLNNSKVIPCRFFIEHKHSEIEILLVKEIAQDTWEAFAKPMKKLKIGETVKLCPGISAEVLARTQDQMKLILKLTSKYSSVKEALISAGSMPIPPYIRKGKAEEKDKQVYQTVYAEVEGSIAAPTAGLHFTAELLAELRDSKIDHCFITLHVGSASFQPVRDENFENFKMPEELFSISDDTLEKIREAKRRGGRIVAVGTTTTRALETVFNNLDCNKHSDLWGTSLFISPGFSFKAVDLLITNFHQPRTTHLLMVAAFIGENETEEIYKHALKSDYRFLSYGDAMILERS